MGKYKVGYVSDFQSGISSNSSDVVAIYEGDKMLCHFQKEDAKEVCRLMMSWLGMNGLSELADRELMDELQERGYTGKLTLEFEL